MTRRPRGADDATPGHPGTPLLDGLSDRLRAVRTGERALVGIDGVDGSGKSVFADRLATRVDG